MYWPCHSGPSMPVPSSLLELMFSHLWLWPFSKAASGHQRMRSPRAPTRDFLHGQEAEAQLRGKGLFLCELHTHTHPHPSSPFALPVSSSSSSSSSMIRVLSQESGREHQSLRLPGRKRGPLLFTQQRSCLPPQPPVSRPLGNGNPPARPPYAPPPGSILSHLRHGHPSRITRERERAARADAEVGSFCAEVRLCQH